MVYNIRDYMVVGLCRSSGTLKNTKEHDVSETRSKSLCSLEYRMDKV
jgi:hypothetical protein